MMTKPLVNPKLKIKASVTITAEEVADDHNKEVVLFAPEAKLKESSGLYFFILFKEINE